MIRAHSVRDFDNLQRRVDGPSKFSAHIATLAWLFHHEARRKKPPQLRRYVISNRRAPNKMLSSSSSLARLARNISPVPGCPGSVSEVEVVASHMIGFLLSGLNKFQPQEIKPMCSENPQSSSQRPSIQLASINRRSNGVASWPS